jgi:hypothetical protein
MWPSLHTIAALTLRLEMTEEPALDDLDRYPDCQFPKKVAGCPLLIADDDLDRHAAYRRACPRLPDLAGSIKARKAA